jgi:hypothetical protein
VQPDSYENGFAGGGVYADRATSAAPRMAHALHIGDKQPSIAGRWYPKAHDFPDLQRDEIRQRHPFRGHEAPLPRRARIYLEQGAIHDADGRQRSTMLPDEPPVERGPAGARHLVRRFITPVQETRKPQRTLFTRGSCVEFGAPRIGVPSSVVEFEWHASAPCGASPGCVAFTM